MPARRMHPTAHTHNAGCSPAGLAQYSERLPSSDPYPVFLCPVHLSTCVLPPLPATCCMQAQTCAPTVALPHRVSLHKGAVAVPVAKGRAGATASTLLGACGSALKGNTSSFNLRAGPCRAGRVRSPALCLAGCTAAAPDTSAAVMHRMRICHGTIRFTPTGQQPACHPVIPTCARRVWHCVPASSRCSAFARAPVSTNHLHPGPCCCTCVRVSHFWPCNELPAIRHLPSLLQPLQDLHPPCTDNLLRPLHAGKATPGGSPASRHLPGQGAWTLRGAALLTAAACPAAAAGPPRAAGTPWAAKGAARHSAEAQWARPARARRRRRRPPASPCSRRRCARAAPRSSRAGGRARGRRGRGPCSRRVQSTLIRTLHPDADHAAGKASSRSRTASTSSTDPLQNLTASSKDATGSTVLTIARQSPPSLSSQHDQTDLSIHLKAPEPGALRHAQAVHTWPSLSEDSTKPNPHRPRRSPRSRGERERLRRRRPPSSSSSRRFL